MPRPPDQGGFSPRGTQRVARAANQVERFDHFRRNGSGPAPPQQLPRQRVSYLVRVTDQPSLGDHPDLYPGVVIEFGGYLSDAPVWSDGQECWIVRTPSDTAGLATGSEGPGELVGETDDDTEDKRLIFAMKPGAGGGGAPVGQTHRFPWTTSLTDTDWTAVTVAVIPSAGKYWFGHTITGRLDASVGVCIGSILVAEFGGLELGLARWCFSHCVGTTTGQTVQTASAFRVEDLPADAVLTLYAMVVKPAGGTFTAAEVGTLDLDFPLLTPAGFGDLYPLDTGITYAKLSADPGVTIPPPPAGTGTLVGKALFDDTTPVVGRTVTLSGATSAATTTAADGRYSFSGVVAGSNTATLSTPGGETCVYEVFGGTGAGFAAPFTQVGGEAHKAGFTVTVTSPPPPPPPVPPTPVPPVPPTPVPPSPPVPPP